MACVFKLKVAHTADATSPWHGTLWVVMAAMLGVTQQQMTRCVKQETGLSFTLFANRYRIDHAKRIMQEQPDTKLASVALASDFTNETSFFRVFKAITGLTPKEWLTRQDTSQ